MWVRPENVPQSSIAKIWTKNTAMPHAQKNKSIDVINVYKRFLKRLKNKKAFLTFFKKNPFDVFFLFSTGKNHSNYFP